MFQRRMKGPRGYSSVSVACRLWRTRPTPEKVRERPRRREFCEWKEGMRETERASERASGRGEPLSAARGGLRHVGARAPRGG
jgi:hypothetical protein